MRDISNTLNREFDVYEPNKVWCGDITCIRAHGKWHYLAVVMDLYARRIVDWALPGNPDADSVTNALNMAYVQRWKPQGLLADGACISQLENRVDTFRGLFIGSAGAKGHQPLPDASLQLDPASSI